LCIKIAHLSSTWRAKRAPQAVAIPTTLRSVCCRKAAYIEDTTRSQAVQRCFRNPGRRLLGKTSVVNTYKDGSVTLQAHETYNAPCGYSKASQRAKSSLTYKCRLVRKWPAKSLSVQDAAKQGPSTRYFARCLQPLKARCKLPRHVSLPIVPIECILGKKSS
jgi:hypothetical protein